MLNLDNYDVNDKAIKEQYHAKVSQYVETLVRNEELKAIVNNKRYLHSFQTIYDSHAGIDPLNCEKATVRSVLKKEASQFLENREQVLKLKKKCTELPAMQEIYGLNLTDRVHIELMAHMINPKIVLDKKIFCIEQQGINVKFDKLREYDSHGKKIKEMLLSLFHHMLSLEGRFFYGIKVRRSDFIERDLRNFSISLDKNISEKNNIRKFTDFCAIFLYGQEATYEIMDKKKGRMPLVQVEMEDFIIRGNMFRCRHESHEIQDITALLDVSDKNGKIMTIKIPAGYCPNCKIFFMLESTYKRVKEKGTLLCKISDEKKYIQGKDKKQGGFATESLLMQYGYSVSEVKGLSQEKRHRILKFIIDNKILSKGEIISYLEFFINQRRTMENMKYAIAKWEEDKKFVEQYCTYTKKEIKVSGIYRK